MSTQNTGPTPPRKSATGPKSPAGKARSSLNALKHGRFSKHATVLTIEDDAAFLSRFRDYLSLSVPNSENQRFSISFPPHKINRNPLIFQQTTPNESKKRTNNQPLANPIPTMIQCEAKTGQSPTELPGRITAAGVGRPRGHTDARIAV